MPLLNLLIFSFDPLEEENSWNARRWAYRKLKSNMEDKLTNHVGSVFAYVKNAKIRKINDKKGGDKQKKPDS